MSSAIVEPAPLEQKNTQFELYRDTSEPKAFSHPQEEIFTHFADRTEVGVSSFSTVAISNPRFDYTDFGTFKTQGLGELQNQDSQVFSDLLFHWGISANVKQNARTAFVPPETGRAILLPETTHPLYRDILVKGSGLNERFTRNNKLRYADRGFDGFLELSEAERDMVHGEILHQAGVLVAASLGVVDHHYVQTYPDFTAWTGNYVRGFRFQTRLSNLFDLDSWTRKLAVNEAIRRIREYTGMDSSLSYVEYFKYILEISAKNVAIMQAIGFTQDSFHFGQLSLCGELTDLGIGHFNKPTQSGVMNTIHPWFRYERQPILMQNMLYKTHAVKAEPEPVRLSKDSRSVQEQQTLFGAIQSFCPQSAHEIEMSDPANLFWKHYNHYYQTFDSARFKSSVLSRLDQYFNWSPETRLLEQLPRTYRLAINDKYLTSLNHLNAHFENQVLTWDRKGPASIHKQKLFGRAVRSVLPEMRLDFSQEEIGVWDESNAGKFFFNHQSTETNQEQDLSWKPTV